MTMEKRIEANQANALLSTGAVTVEGKTIVSRNAIKHGIFTKDLIIKSGICQENEVEYQELLNGIIDSLSPQGQLESLLVEKIALDFWRLKRVIRFESGSMKKYLDEVLDDYYNSWQGSSIHFSEEMTDQKIENAQSIIDWNKKYLTYLQRGVVKFDQSIWKENEFESDIEDDFYMIANSIERKHFSSSEKDKLQFGELNLSELKQIIARAGYTTEKEITDKLILCIEKQNDEQEKEIQKLETQRAANRIADQLNARLCSLSQDESLEKVLKYERSIQKSIYQNLIMLKKIQGLF
jgi:hypothetical protein